MQPKQTKINERPNEMQKRVTEVKEETFPYREELESLKTMGFDEAQAKACLLAANGNLTLAANFLTGVNFINSLGCYTFYTTRESEDHGYWRIC